MTDLIGNNKNEFIDNETDVTDVADVTDIEDEDFAEVVDLDGELFEKLDEIEYDGGTYFALIPFEEEYDEKDTEIMEFGILRKIEEDGEFFLETIDDEDLHDTIGKMFEERFDNLQNPEPPES